MTGAATSARPRDAAALTPPVGEWMRRTRFWAIVAVIAVLVAVAATVLTNRATAGGEPLAADNPAPGGSMALVRVLEQQGVHVVKANTLGQAVRALGAADSSLFLSDPNGYLDRAQLRRLASAAHTSVLPTPGFDALTVFAPSVTASGEPSSSAAPRADCTLTPARKAAIISTPQLAYRSSNPSDATCFPTGNGAFALLESDIGGATVNVVGSDALFSNDGIVSRGNAALALNLLGTERTLVWYLPTIADVQSSGPPSLGELTPGWLTPAILLLICATIAAGVWRGRRFGPLVIENLPVVVRAEETMEGRARLYQRSSARLRALDALRIGTIARVAVSLGMPRTAPALQVADAAAALLGASPWAVRSILIDEAPRTDGDLMRLATGLAELERAVAERSGIGHGHRNEGRASR